MKRWMMIGVMVSSSMVWGAEPPVVGDKARDFALKDLEGKETTLAQLTQKGPAVILVLRGYPGYQCPLCSVQVGEFLSKAKAFADANATILLIYPGPAEDLADRAKEFMGKRMMPANVQLVIDPDYTFVDAYGLRWDAPRETAYPSTFLIDKAGIVRWTKISRTHGDRSRARDVLAELTKAGG